MGFTGSLLGGVIGWAVAGPLGGIVGSLIGGGVSSSIGSRTEGAPGASRPRAVRRGGEGASAAIALVVLMAAVTRADKKVSKGEVAYVKEFLLRSFGRENAADMMKVYKEALDRELDLAPICEQMRAALPRAALSQLIHTLIGLVQADSEAAESEIRMVREIARRLGLPDEELSRIEAMYWNDTDSAYKVLGATSTDSMTDIKKKYRELAKKYHPDKVSHLGEEFRELARKKFVQIQEAYETIEKSRA